MIVEAGGWPPSAICTERREPFQFTPSCYSPSPSWPLAIPMAPPKRFSTAKKGKARQEGPGSPPAKRGRGRPRKHPTAPAAASRGRGNSPLRSGGRPAAIERYAGAARPPRPRFRSAEVLPEFVVWSADPTSTWLQLPCFFVDELPAGARGGLWLQADGCCSRASWASLEVSASGNAVLTRGWQTFARARGLSRRCTLHFKFDGDTTLYVRVFGEDGRRAGCCPEDDDSGRAPSLGVDRDEDGGRRGGCRARGSPSFGDSSSVSSSSSGGRDHPPCRPARLGEGSGPVRRCASVKREEGI